MDRDAILLTPGPLTTTLRTKLAMLRDWGSWDADFNAMTAELRRQLLAIIHGQDSHVVVPLQGSGTFSVEAAVATLVPPTSRGGHILVLDNGAYCKRLGALATLMGRRTTVLAHAEHEPVSAEAVDKALQADASITHVGFIHCETGTGGMRALGFQPFLRAQWQASIIVTFPAPRHPAYDFKAFYAEVKRRGFILYPGKLTQVETFRVGCIGAIGANAMRQAVNAVAEAMQALGSSPSH